MEDLELGVGIDHKKVCYEKTYVWNYSTRKTSSPHRALKFKMSYSIKVIMQLYVSRIQQKK